MVKNELLKGTDAPFFTENNLMTGEAQNIIERAERTLKAVKEAEAYIRTKLCEEMQEKGIYKVDAGHLKITLKDAYTRETFDSKKFREVNPDLYNEYVNFSEIKESVVIKID